MRDKRIWRIRVANIVESHTTSCVKVTLLRRSAASVDIPIDTGWLAAFVAAVTISAGCRAAFDHDDNPARISRREFADKVPRTVSQLRN